MKHIDLVLDKQELVDLLGMLEQIRTDDSAVQLRKARLTVRLGEAFEELLSEEEEVDP